MRSYPSSWTGQIARCGTVCATSEEGEWLKVAATDYDFKVSMSTSAASFRGQLEITCHTVFLWDG